MLPVASCQPKQKMEIEPDKKMMWEAACAACREGVVPELLMYLEQDPEVILFQDDESYLVHIAFEAGNI